MTLMPALSSGPITADQDDASAHAACTRTIVASRGRSFINYLSRERSRHTHMVSYSPAAGAGFVRSAVTRILRWQAGDSFAVRALPSNIRVLNC
jgi:hypothetical protein